jgi:ferrous iron transport protein B
LRSLAKQNNLPDIVFIGQPNCGKSTLFNAVAGLKAETSNFPGTTVEHTHSKVTFKGKVLNIIDLPGTYSLNPSGEVEKVALTHLFVEKPDLVVNVIDTSILGRSLEMTLELIELGYPLVVVLNMLDLAERKGIEVDVEKMTDLLGVPVVPAIATRGRGIKELLDSILTTLGENKMPSPIEWSKDVEDKIVELEKLIPSDFPVVSNKRFTAVKMIETERLIFNKMLMEINPSLKASLDNIRGELEARHNAPAYEVIAAERHHLAFKIFETSSRVTRRKKIDWTERVDDVIMHPLLGYLILIGVFFAFFFVIFEVGNPLEELLLGPVNSLRSYLAVPLGRGLLFYLAEGLIQGIGGGVAIVLPYFIPLLFLMALLEDIGYLARASFLMDTFMHRIGLHGNSVSPFILGFGCNVPAVVSTRILASRRDRIITTLLIPFVPCSARTTIILALIAFYLGPFWALGFYIFNIFLLGVLGRILSFFFKEPSPGLILEIPTLKMPSLKNMARKTFVQLRAFIKFAWPILIVGSVILALMQFFKLDTYVNLALSPLVAKALGLPQELGVTLVFGFLRKELSLVMMLQALGVGYQDLMNVITYQQMVIFVVFISFFIPCLSTVAIIWREVGKKIALLSVALNTGVAVVISLVMRLAFKL